MFVFNEFFGVMARDGKAGSMTHEEADDEGGYT